MIRLTLATLFSIFAVMTIFGTGDGRKVTKTAPEITMLRLESIQPVKAETSAVRVIKSPTQMTAPATQAVLTNASFTVPEESVQSSATQKIAPTQTPETIMYVSGSRVNLRSGPSTSHEKIGQLTRGDAAVILDTLASDWVQIRDPETGISGFMAGRFLQSQ